jgi:hypothetical protein
VSLAGILRSAFQLSGAALSLLLGQYNSLVASLTGRIYYFRLVAPICFANDSAIVVCGVSSVRDGI